MSEGAIHEVGIGRGRLSNGSVVSVNLSDNKYKLKFIKNETTTTTTSTILVNEPIEIDAITTTSHTSCRILDVKDWPVFQWAFFMISYLVPLLLIGGLYLCMLIRLWQAPRISADGLRGRKRVTRLVAVVVGVFAFSWAPIQVCLFIYLFSLKNFRFD